MSVESATQDVQVSVGKDLSTMIIQGVKVEVSPKSNVVVYTNESVQTKPATAGTGWAASGDTEINVGKDFNTVALYGAKVELAADGSVIVYTNGTVKVKPGPANDTAAKATHEIGDIESDGDHKGEIYGGILPADKKPIWFSQPAPKLMDHYNAAAWAEGQGGSLPTRKQGDYLDTIKDQGAFKTLFNRSGSFPAGFVWLAEPYSNFKNIAWCQRLSGGGQNISIRVNELPVLSVRR